MAFKFGKNFDEMCYPFTQESSSLCDFEVIVDASTTQPAHPDCSTAL